jgi:hypothetical protein
VDHVFVIYTILSPEVHENSRGICNDSDIGPDFFHGLTKELALGSHAAFSGFIQIYLFLLVEPELELVGFFDEFPNPG